MDTSTGFFRQLPLDIFAQPHRADVWERSPLAQAPDAQLIHAVAAAITPPKRDAFSSFILHAPLELLARASLLPYIACDARALARRRVAEVAARYAQAGDEILQPDKQFASKDAAASALKAALRDGDIDGADEAVTFLSMHASATEIRAALIDEIAPMLGAAGHAPILLAQLPAHDDGIRDMRALLRAPVRTLAKGHDKRVTWHLAQSALDSVECAEERLFAVLASPPRFSSPSNSIAPTLLAAEGSGHAARLLAPIAGTMNVAAASRVLLRIAAWSMLQDDPRNVPYGWTHCLTLPQALLQNADVARDQQALVAVAATSVLAFRATEGNADIDTAKPLPPEAHAVFVASPDQHWAVIESLATFAATHHDAHVAKYTLACMQAAANDREAAPLFLAAAAHLHAWWRHHDATAHC
jgi:hypothetical protein